MAQRVLVVDDDDIAGGLSKELLADAGFDAQLLTNSLQAIDLIRRERYELVVLDILMPGIDGLTLCHKIKSDPELKDTKVVMVSGKSFDADKQRARQYGAALFIEKPYNVETFVQTIKDLLGRELSASSVPAARPPDKLSSNPDPVAQLTVWGCRSRPSRSARESRYGQRTSCVSIEIAGKLFIFDAGTGLADLGAQIEAAGGPRELWMFMTHFHPDHTDGLAHFASLAKPECTVHLGGAPEPDRPLPELVQHAFDSTEASIGAVEAEIDLYELLEQAYEIVPGVKLTPFYANHPGKTLGFTLESRGRKLVYSPDSEVYGETATAMQDYDDRLSKICAGADLLIHDARYTPEDYRLFRNGGHSSFLSVVDLAGRSAVKRLMLFHHDDRYDDATLDRIGSEAARRVAERGYKLECVMARPGLKVGV